MENTEQKKAIAESVRCKVEELNVLLTEAGELGLISLIHGREYKNNIPMKNTIKLELYEHINYL